MRQVAVFDTNVLVSALGWRGNARRCLDFARAGAVEGVTCPEILEELSEVLERKLGFRTEQAVEHVAELLTFLRLVTIPGRLQVVAADPDDDKVVECAVVAGAAYVVTGDRRHLLPLGEFRGISFVTPAVFAALVEPPA